MEGATGHLIPLFAEGFMQVELSIVKLFCYDS